MQTTIERSTPISINARRPAASRVPLLILLGVLAMYSGAVFSLRYFPTLDGPMLMYYADAFQSLVRGAPVFHSYFALDKTFGSHLFYFYFVTAMAPFFSPIIIEKIFIVVYLAWLSFAFYYFANSIAPGRGFPAALFVFPFALNANVYWAFYDFSIGMATALFVCGWWLRSFNRMNARRAVTGAFLLLGIIFMHVVDAAMVLLFAGVHTLVCAWMEQARAHRDLKSFVRRFVQVHWRPLAALAGGAAILYSFKPPSVGKSLTTYFFEEPWERIYQLSVMRPFGPYESRFYRGLLGIIILAAMLMIGLAIWRHRRKLATRPAWAASIITSLICFSAFVVVPFWIAGGAYIPHRFVMFGAFFLLAPAAVFPLRRKEVIAVSAGAAAVAFAAILFQVQMGRMLINRYSAALDFPTPHAAALGAVVQEDEVADPQVNYQAQLWAGTHYLRRSGTALLNSPWLDVPGNWFRVTERQPCQFLHPILMRGCLAKAATRPNAPRLDILVGVRARVFVGPMPPDIGGSVASRYGLTKVWSSDFMAIYAKPEIAAELRQSETHATKATENGRNRFAVPPVASATTAGPAR